jgi:hypothetical protein
MRIADHFEELLTSNEGNDIFPLFRIWLQIKSAIQSRVDGSKNSPERFFVQAFIILEHLWRFKI